MFHIGGGSPKRYWPLSAATINFFAISGAGLTNSHITIPDDFSPATVVYTSANSYSDATQSDIMYAFNRGSVEQTGNALIFPEKVDMIFKHALALINFRVKAADAASEAIQVNSITIDGAKFTGTLTLTNSSEVTATSGDVTTTVSWTGDGAIAHSTIPNITNYTLSDDKFYPDGTSGGETNWACKMIIPNTTSAFTSFTVNYTYDSKEYSYTYTPVSTAALAGYKYTYDITFKLHEILINPSVALWDETTPINYVDVPTQSFAYVASTGETGTYTLPSATAGTYSCTITGLPADTYTVEEKTDEGTDFITAVVPSTSVTLGAGDPLNISFTVSASSGNNRKIVIKNDELTPVTLFTLNVTQP